MRESSKNVKDLQRIYIEEFKIIRDCLSKYYDGSRKVNIETPQEMKEEFARKLEQQMRK